MPYLSLIIISYILLVCLVLYVLYKCNVLYKHNTEYQSTLTELVSMIEADLDTQYTIRPTSLQILLLKSKELCQSHHSSRS